MKKNNHKQEEKKEDILCKLDDVPDINDTKYIKIGLIVIFVIFGIFGTWSGVALLDSGVPLMGKVVTQANNKIVQHLEGGIVEKIYVDSGDHVNKGDMLIKLSDAKAKSSLLSIEANYYEALAKADRLMAENQKLDKVTFSKELDALEPQKKEKLIKAQLEIFYNDKNSYEKNEKIAAQKTDSLNKQIQSLEDTIQIKEKLLVSYENEAKEQEELLKENLTDKVQLRDVRRKIDATKSDILSNKTEIEKAKIQINEVLTQLALNQEDYFRKIKEELRKTQTSIDDMRARMIELKDRLKRTNITAPVSGTVLNMTIHTIGAVVSPGNPIMEIVPDDSKLIIEAKLPPEFRDYVHVDSKANMTFPSFQMKGRFIHNIEGEVILVAADATTDKKGNSYYVVKLIVDKEGEKTLKDANLEILAGMPANVTVKIGKQTTLEYLLKPMTVMLDKAFLEE